MTANRKVAAALALLATGAALIVFALIRRSVLGGWDRGCTLAAIPGAAGLLIGAIARRSALLRSARSRGARFGVQSILSSLLLLGLLGVLNYAVVRHNQTLDLTGAKLFTLAPQTRKVLRSLSQDVTVLAFFPAGRQSQALDLLRRYADLSPRFHGQIIDPDESPEKAREYEVTAYGATIVMAKGSPRKPIRIEPDTQGNPSLTEQKLTNAIVKATETRPRIVYFLTGDGEGDVESSELNGYSDVRTLLESSGFDVQRLNLSQKPAVPGNCDILVVAGPGAPLLPAEVSAIQKYMERGGKAMLLIDPPPGAGMEGFLKDWSLKSPGDVIQDPGADRLYGTGPNIPVVSDYDARSPITHDFHRMTLFPVARPLLPQESLDAQVWPLAQTGPQSYAEPDNGEKGSRLPGPLLVGAAVTRETTTGKEARLVVFGTSNLISNSFLDRAGNSDLFMNAMNWLAEQEDQIAIQPRQPQDRRIDLTEGQVRLYFWIVVVGMPAAVLLTGAIVFWRRSRAR